MPTVSNAISSRYGGFAPQARFQCALVPHHSFVYVVGSDADLKPSTRLVGKV